MNNELIINFNKELNYEFNSSYFYFGISTYFIETNYQGLSKFMREQAVRELEHAQKIYDFLIIRNSSIRFEKIDAPNNNFKSPLDAFTKAYEYERFITSKINELSHLSGKYKDLPCVIFLQEFIMEQIEEENKFYRIVEKIKKSENKNLSIIDELDYHLKL